MTRAAFTVAALVLGAASLLASVRATGVPAERALLVLVRGGTFRMGSSSGLPQEAPPHHVTVGAFRLDRDAVTNARFAGFVRETAYRTEAERIGWAGVFRGEGGWQPTRGADWRHPAGPASSVVDRPAYPVVQVSWADAQGFCAWAGKRLPREAEFEFAARGGLAERTYAWGDTFTPQGHHRANTWQGRFPAHDAGTDGFRGLAPVGSFPPNGFGLRDLTGNVWEWTADWYSPDTYARDEGARDPRGAAQGTERVIRGGSWMCSAHYCAGYRVAARQASAPDSALDNLGFRCAADAPSTP